MPDEKINVKFTGDAKGVQQAATDAQKAVENAGKGISKATEASNKALDGLKVGGTSLKTLKDAFAGGAAAGAVFAAGIQALGQIAKTVWGWIEQKAKDAAEAIRRGAESQREANEANRQQREAVLSTMKAISDLNNAEQLSNEQKAQMVNLVGQLSRQQAGLNLQIDEGTGKIKDFDAAYMAMLERNKKRSIDELKRELGNATGDADRARDDMEKESTWWRKIRNGGDSKVEEATKRYEDALKRRQELIKKIRDLEKTDPAGDYKRQAEGKKKDAAAKAAQQAQAKAKSLDDERQNLAIATQQAQGNTYQAARMNIRRQYAQKLQALGGKNITQADLKQLNDWAAAEYQRIADEEKKANEAKNKAIAAENERALRAQHEAKVKQIKADAEAEIKAQQEAIQRISAERAKYKFTLPTEYDPLTENGAELQQRRMTQNLDARIQEKLQRQAQGEYVTFDAVESERIRKAQELEQKRKDAEEKIKKIQQESAEKLLKASQALEKAVAALTGQPQATAQNATQTAQKRAKGRNMGNGRGQGNSAATAQNSRPSAKQGKKAAQAQPMPKQTAPQMAQKLPSLPKVAQYQPITSRLDRIAAGVDALAKKTFRVV